METSLPSKICVKCKEFRLFTEYCKNKYGVDGLFRICNFCQKEYLNYNKPIKFEYGRFVYEKYVEKHLKLNIHKKYLMYYSEVVNSAASLTPQSVLS
jgi:hypothetical protein